MARRQVNIRLPEAEAEKLARLAAARGMSQSELIVRLLQRVQETPPQAAVQTFEEIVAPIEEEAAARCRHPSSKQVKAWGQRECLDCGALYVPPRPT